jgi:hypothetical protein
MLEYTRRILIGQFEAALAMLNEVIQACPPQHWEAKVASLTFKQVAYHTLFFVDLYLEPTEERFELRNIHKEGGDERNPYPSPGLDKPQTLKYVRICYEKMLTTLAGETQDSLQGPCGFSWRKDISRGELHIYNTRHVQHHTGQLSACLRRVEPAFRDHRLLRWVGTGWREPQTS